MRSPDELSTLFRARGRKVTPQRQSIFRALDGNEAHPTAEAVYDAVAADMPAISLKTVYQTLHELADLGEVALLDLGTGAARFDPNVEDPHHHLVCDRCGKVRDFYADFGDLEIPVEARQGFRVGTAEIVFRGLCESCEARAVFPRPTNHKERHG